VKFTLQEFTFSGLENMYGLHKALQLQLRSN